MAISLGSDLSCVGDLDLTGREVSEKLCLVQALARRLITPRGRLIDDPNYGYDLSQWLGSDIGPVDIAQIQHLTRAEVMKDERLQSATVTAQFLAASNTMIVTISVSTVLGNLQLVLGVNAVTTTIITVAL